jgi:histidine triad (HIT) family protein
MENPLTQEQIAKIQYIQTLKGEDQQKAWDEFLKTLSKEQYEFLVNQNKQQEGGGDCFFCGIIEGKVDTYKLYEDGKVLVILDINPANVGHALVIPKEHIVASYEKKDVGYFFNIANMVAKKIKDNLEMDSNIFVANGEKAGQKGQHFLIHVIPRKSEDKVNMIWEGSSAEEKDLKEMQEKLKITVVEQPKEPKVIKEVKEKEERRIP